MDVSSPFLVGGGVIGVIGIKPLSEVREADRSDTS